MSFAVSLQHKNNLYYSTMESGSSLTFGSGKKDSVHVDEIREAQYSLASNGNEFQIKTSGNISQTRENIPLNRQIEIGNAGEDVLYITYSTGMARNEFKLPHDGKVTVGRNDKNDISIELPVVSGRHFTIMCSNGVMRVEDNNSTNGLYLNGRKISNAVLRSGDVLNILTVRIHLINDVLKFENVGNALTINWNENKNQPDIRSRKSVKNKHLSYRRSPRIRERLPQYDIVLASPPAAAQEFNPGNNLANIINYGTMMATSLAYGMSNPVLLALRTASSASNMIFSRKRNNEMKKKLETYEQDRREKYTAYMEEQLARITKVAEVQQRVLNNENPTPQECVKSAKELRLNIWERSSSDNDFLDVRLGVGPNELCVKIKSRVPNSGFAMKTDVMEELCEHVAEESVMIQAPVRIPLKKYNSIGVIGDREDVRYLVRNMVISLTALHNYQEVRIVGIFDKEERSSWAMLRWLPHIWDENKQFRFLAFDKERAHTVCNIINDIAKKRMDAARSNSFEKASAPLPYYVLLMGSREMTEREQLMQTLALNNPDTGMTALFLYDDIYYLPQTCEYIVELNDNPAAYETIGINYKTYFELDDAVPRNEFDEFTRQLSAIKLEDFRVDNSLPNSITFLEGYGVKKVEELNILQRWRGNNVYRSLTTPIGVMASGKVFSLDVHFKADGPHGLIAGTTGSGKSEFIQSWILSMAVNYHPYEVNFVIIDYKGGSMANLLEPLPHVVGKITNIDSNIQRVLVSISAETKRREHILKENGDISFEQYQRLYKAGKISEPLPHLIMVSDEFAELKAEEPEFMAALKSFARVGRSLGVHLVLATQKPGGIVDDQIEANSRFRVCMKVNDASDSRELLKRPDAATITQAGRGFVRVGNDEVFELIQTYYSGADYNPQNPNKASLKNKVRIVETTGQRIDLKKDEEKTQREEFITELAAIRAHIVQIAAENGIEKLPGLWCEELPEAIPLEDIVTDGVFNGYAWQPYSGRIMVPIGIFDDPHNQIQGTQYLDLTKDSHYAIYGGPTSGKTNFIKTVIMSLALYYSPEDVNIYAMDFGGRSISAFEELPHMGSVALDYEEEKLQNLKQMLFAELEDRKRKFEQHKISSFVAYRENVGNDMPEIVLLVDNIMLAINQFPFLKELFERVTAVGSTYGIHFIFTANNQNGLGANIPRNVSGAIALKMNERTEYQSCVGRVDNLSIPNQPGSAVIRRDAPLPVLKFQTAFFAKGDNEKQRNEILKDIIAQMNKVAGSKAHKVATMPESIEASQLQNDYVSRNILPIGINFSDLQTAYMELDKQYILNICGEKISDTYTTLDAIVSLLLARQDNEVYIFENTQSILEKYAEQACGYACYEDEELFKGVFNKVLDFLNERQNGNDSSERKQICVVVNDIMDFTKKVSDSANKAMSAVCRMGAGLDIIVIVSSQIEELSSDSITNIVARNVIRSQKVVAVSGKLLRYSCYDNSLSLEEKAKPLVDKAAVIDNGNVNYIKTVGSEGKVKR